MENQTKKEVVFSAIQPSGTITLGNYLGAVRNWVTMQNEYDCIYALADLHTITVRQTPAVMRKNIIDAYASIMACGIDVEKSPFLHSESCSHSRRACMGAQLLHTVRRAFKNDAVQGQVCKARRQH